MIAIFLNTRIHITDSSVFIILSNPVKQRASIKTNTPKTGATKEANPRVVAELIKSPRSAVRRIANIKANNDLFLKTKAIIKPMAIAMSLTARFLIVQISKELFGV